MTARLKNIDGRRYLTPAVHLLIIGLIFILPEALMRMAFPWRGPSMPWIVYAKTGLMIAAFYINYFFIIPATLLHSRHRWRFVLLNLALIAIFSVASYLLSSIGWHHKHHHDINSAIISATFLIREAVTLVLTLSLAVVLRLSGRWVELERRQQQLISASRESELESLRAQLNPHFLFNTLNSIYALILIDPDKARNAVHRLSSLLRYVVYENPDEVPLEREVDFVDSYVDLMRLRMGSRPVTFKAEGDLSSATIAPLVFVTLVENAFKHGNTADTSLPIHIGVEARPDAIICRTFNHYDRAARRQSPAAGVGLANLKRRLELLYGTDATLDIDFRNDESHVELIIRKP